VAPLMPTLAYDMKKILRSMVVWLTALVCAGIVISVIAFTDVGFLDPGFTLEVQRPFVDAKGGRWYGVRLFADNERGKDCHAAVTSNSPTRSVVKSTPYARADGAAGASRRSLDARRRPSAANCGVIAASAVTGRSRRSDWPNSGANEPDVGHPRSAAVCAGRSPAASRKAGPPTRSAAAWRLREWHA